MINLVKRLFKFVWRLFNFSRVAITNLLFLALVIVILAALFGEEKKSMPDSAALLLNIEGDLVEQKKAVDPFDAFSKEVFGSKDEPKEILLRDVLFAIENAKQDKRIKALVLETSHMRSAGLNKLQEIGKAIEDFKTSGKPVFAIGDYFPQKQYYLASYADTIFMNPQGMVALDGYGRYRMYYKSALEKLKVTTHVFKVGTYKSAIEPFVRDDMSEEAKEANLEWLGDLWQVYRDDVARNRDLPKETFDYNLDKLITELDQTDGDFGKLALEAGLVDELVTREQMREALMEVVGQDEDHKSFNQVWLGHYLSVIQPHKALHAHEGDSVGVVVAKGTILNGHQPPGTIGGDSTAWLLRQARFDPDIKAVVLRVDSPGGSAFASELIRNEIDELKKAGKPVVASMSSYAASGGYWISVSADEIWAAPSTITGSIGIFGMLTTLDRTLDHIGIHADGVGTSDLSGLSVSRPLDPRLGQVIQRSIDHGYDKFINLVAKEREMTAEQVDGVAQGRVWSGSKAKKLGLVDELGTLQQAISAAAALAGLEHYDVKDVQKPMSFKQQLLMELFGGVKAWLPQSDAERAPALPNSLQAGLQQLLGDIVTFSKLNDPQGVYALCLTCEL